MPPLLRLLCCLLAAVSLPICTGVPQLIAARADLLSPPPSGRPLAPRASPALNPAKPTVAVVLGADVSEVADVLAPYAVFAASGRFNVVTTAPTGDVVALTGGLDVRPHFTLTGLDRALPGGPAVIVVPNIPNIRAARNRPIVAWLRRHGQAAANTQASLLLSICTGADTLALTGLLNETPATTHWGDLGRLAEAHPKVRWVRGQRYVDAGRLVSSAGVLSGIDASLHVVSRLAGRPAALTAARRLGYPNLRFLDDPTMPQYAHGWPDLIYLFNGAFLWDRPSYALPLRDGADELRLAALFDAHAASLVARLATTGPVGTEVVSRYGLWLVPRHDPARTPVPPLELVGSGFAFDLALADLAQRQDGPTARYAAKRLEYRFAPPMPGCGWWGPALYRPLLLGLLGAALMACLLRRRAVR